MVDIDGNEMHKKSVHPNMEVVCDARYFLEKMLADKKGLYTAQSRKWIAYCDEMKKRYPVFIPETEPRAGYVSTYR